MSFDSLTYVIFLPTICFLHRLTPARWRWALLLLASYGFYASWNISLSLLIFTVTVCSYGTGLLLEKAASPVLRRAFLIGMLTLMLGLLGYFKYFNLLGRTLAMLTGGGWQTMDIILPVGVSFSTPFRPCPM